MKKVILFSFLFISNLFFSQLIILAAEDFQIAEKNKQNLGGEKMWLVLVCHEKIHLDSEDETMNFENIDLSSDGIKIAKQLGKKLKKDDYSFDIAYTSHLKVANTTIDCILEEMNESQIPKNNSSVLNTLKYKNLDRENIFCISEFKVALEKIEFYLKNDILKNIKTGRNILVVTDENTIRVFIKYLLNMEDTDVMEVYIPTDNSFEFEIDQKLNIGRVAFPFKDFLPERIDYF